MTPACNYCKFAQTTETQFLECHRNPPVKWKERLTGEWPFVAPNQWCGEFQKGINLTLDGPQLPLAEPAPRALSRVHRDFGVRT